MPEPIPVLQREESVHAGDTTPNFASATNKLADSEGTLGAIGASVAQAASNQMATQLGLEQGKTPNGDLSPPLTDFDKHFAESYEQQAHATLSTQGQKLLDDTHLALSKANTLTPDLISNATNQLQLGLNKIADQAPTNVKTKLSEQFNSNVLNFSTQYSEKMISQQREDQKNTLTNGIDIAVKNTLEFAKNGDMKGAAAAAKSAKQMADNARNNRFMTPEEQRVAHETADQTLLNGQYTYLAMQALKNNQYPQFEDNYAKNKPSGMTNEQWLSTGQAFKQQVSFIQGMQQQDENLKSQEMINRIAADPTSITGTEWQTYASSVSPVKAAKVQFKYIQALQAHSRSSASIDTLVNNFSDPKVWANSSPEMQNGAFNKSVQYAQQAAKNNGSSLSQDDAEIQVAASAGGAVPVFTKELKSQLHSGNPAYMDAAASKIYTLQAMGAGHALTGLDDQDKTLYTMYNAMRSSTDPTTAAQNTVKAVLDQDPEVQKANSQMWATKVSTATTGTTPVNYALKTFGMSKDSFMNPSMAQVYGADILNKYKTFYQLANGDDNVAKTMTQQYVDSTYGDTHVNGSSYKTMHPIEKTLGFQTSDCIPYIQHDAANQMQQKFASIKKLFDDKKSNEYWEVQPVTGNKHGIFSTNYDPIQVKRYMRQANGTMKTDTFNVALQGNAINNYDVAIQTATGMRNIYQVAPYLGVVSYTPNADTIHANYLKDHPLK